MTAPKFVGDLAHPHLRIGALQGYLRQALEGIETALTYMPDGICVAARELLEKQAAEIRDTLARIAEVDGS